MATQQVQQLVRMANQIALNLGAHRDHETAARRVGDHLRRFWTPDMCAQLLVYWQSGGEELAPVVVAALQQLAAEDMA